MDQPTNMSNFKILKKIGQGAFGKVYKVLRKSDNLEYAIKVINVSQMDKDSINNTLNEIRILSSIQHNNIVCYKEAFVEKFGKEMNIVMEYVSGGDLDNVIQKQKRKKQYLKEDQIWNVLCQILMGLKKLHDMKVIHRDIKAGNIFVSENLDIVKLGDLNVAKVVKHNFASTQVGTPYYLAPEIWDNDLYDYKCDIFSLGVAMYELICFQLPFEGRSIQQIYNKIKRGKYQKIPLHFSQDLHQIIKEMLTINPKFRPNVDNLLQKDIIKNKMQQFGFNQNTQQQNINQLAETILAPRNLKLLNQKLPQNKNYKKRASSVTKEVNTNQIIDLINNRQNRNLPPIKNIQNGILPPIKKQENQNNPPKQKRRQQSPQVKRYHEYLKKLNEQSKKRKMNLRRGNSIESYQQKIRF